MSPPGGPAEPGQPYWWDGWVPPALPSDCPDRTDILVIGAGYTGLSAAIAAHDGGASVAVLDAGQPGQGASTRNGGMFGAHPRLGWEALASSFGAGVADALFAEAAPALAFARGLIAAEGIDCDHQRTGRIQLAWTPAHLESQKRLAGQIRAKSDVRVEVIDRAGLAAEIATERYFGGILFPDHGAIQPRKFHDGLLAAARRRGISVAAGRPVTALTRQAGGFTAETPQGPVRAEKVILATNGYTGAAFPWHRARVFPVPSYIIATESLPEGLPERLAPGRRMMVETRARHSYFRLSPDGRRLLFGGRASLRDLDLGTAARRLRRTMAEIWPEAAEVRLTHVWTGNTGYSFSHMPTVGEADGLHYAMGYSGSGTVLAPWLGAKAAWRALGDKRGATAYARTALRRHWLHRFGPPWFLWPADLWYRFVVDPRETRAGRRG